MMQRLRRTWGAAGLIAALGLAGCGAQIASTIGAQAQQVWVQCPGGFTLGGPVWSPEGIRIEIVPRSQPPRYTVEHTIALIDPDTGAMGPITSILTDRVSRSPAVTWAPDGSGFAYVYDSASSYYLTSTDTGETAQTISQNVIGKLNGSAWSPDGERIAFYYVGAGNPASNIYVVNREGEMLWRLSDRYPEMQAISSPAWSPDGSRIAFIWHTGRDGSSLALAEADGTSLAVLLTEEYATRRVQWSPDGQLIAYTTYDPLAGRMPFTLHVVRPDGSEHRAHPVDLGRESTWMLTDAEFVYVTDDREIGTLSLSSGAVTLHAPLPVEADAWSFSPDGTRLAYVASHGPYSVADLFVMNIDGTRVQQLTRNPGSRRCLQWPF